MGGKEERGEGTAFFHVSMIVHVGFELGAQVSIIFINCGLLVPYMIRKDYFAYGHRRCTAKMQCAEELRHGCLWCPYLVTKTSQMIIHIL